MNDSLDTLSPPVISPEAHTFAVEMGIDEYLNGVISLAHQAFPSSPVCLALGQDAEDETHRYVALDVETGDRTVDELLAGQRVWSAGIGGICPSHLSVYFVLSWR